MSEPTAIQLALRQMIEDQRAADIANGEWFTLPIPRRFHRCRAATHRGGVQRCACGAIRFDGWLIWHDRNDRLKYEKTKQQEANR